MARGEVDRWKGGKVESETHFIVGMQGLSCVHPMVVGKLEGVGVIWFWSVGVMKYWYRFKGGVVSALNIYTATPNFPAERTTHVSSRIKKSSTKPL